MGLEHGGVQARGLVVGHLVAVGVALLYGKPGEEEGPEEGGGDLAHPAPHPLLGAVSHDDEGLLVPFFLAYGPQGLVERKGSRRNQEAVQPGRGQEEVVGPLPAGAPEVGFARGQVLPHPEGVKLPKAWAWGRVARGEAEAFLPWARASR